LAKLPRLRRRLTRAAGYVGATNSQKIVAWIQGAPDFAKLHALLEEKLKELI
jgi:hypothetical protein